jgi:ribosomal-protein-alanine N-acetyltransferase
MDQASSTIEIRPVEQEDAQLLFDLMTTDKWMRFIGDRGINTIEDAIEYIENRMHPDLSIKGFVNHVIIEKHSGAKVGTCSLHNRAGVDGLDVGYAILEEHEGKGYAAAGAREMVKLAFNKHKADKVSAITIEENVGSCRVLEKLGFEFREFMFLPNDASELKLYALFKDAWESYATI